MPSTSLGIFWALGSLALLLSGGESPSGSEKPKVPKPSSVPILDKKGLYAFFLARGRLEKGISRKKGRVVSSEVE